MKKVCISVIIILVVTCISHNVFSADSDKTDLNEIYNGSANPGIINATSKVLGAVQVVGYSTAVIMLTYIGIKFLLDTPDEKAKHKEQLIPFIIGAVILFGGTTIAVWIGKAARNDLKLESLSKTNDSEIVCYENKFLKSIKKEKL